MDVDDFCLVQLGMLKQSSWSLELVSATWMSGGFVSDTCKSCNEGAAECRAFYWVIITSKY